MMMRMMVLKIPPGLVLNARETTPSTARKVPFQDWISR